MRAGNFDRSNPRSAYPRLLERAANGTLPMKMASRILFGTTLVVAALSSGANDAGAQGGARDWDAERRRMVDEQLRARGIRDARVLDVMRTVPRHLFVPEPQRALAYSDSPLPIGSDQTISQPYIVAFMTEELKVEPGHRVLEVGTGSGYQAAVLGLLAKEVYTIEIVSPLAKRARETLDSLGFRNIQVRTGNGYLGWPEHAPYDRIIVTAAPEEVPPVLIQQLKIGGLMAIPVGTAIQELRILRRTATGTRTLRTLPVRFVPMTGKPPGSPARPRRSAQALDYLSPVHLKRLNGSGRTTEVSAEPGEGQQAARARPHRGESGLVPPSGYPEPQ